MEWLRGHPRATLGVGLGVVAAAQLAIMFGGFDSYMVMALVFVPYVVLAFINAWVLRLRGRSRHWLWFYLLYSWGGALIPVCLALFTKPAQSTSKDHVPTPSQ